MHFLTAKTTKQTAYLLPLKIPFSEWACDVTQVKKTMGMFYWRNYILGEISLLHYTASLYELAFTGTHSVTGQSC